MKKVFTTILLACAMMSVGTLCASAQKSNSKKTAKTTTVATPSLQGTWVCTEMTSIFDEEISSMMPKTNLTLTFGASDFSLLFDILATPNKDGMSMEMGMNFGMKGSYTKKDKSITLSPNPESVNIDLYKFSINLPEEQKSAMKAMGITEESLKAMIANGIKNDKSVSTISDAFTKPLTITEHTATTLVLTNEDGKALPFTRK